VVRRARQRRTGPSPADIISEEIHGMSLPPSRRPARLLTLPLFALALLLTGCSASGGLGQGLAPRADGSAVEADRD
jgi:hypothetical protein